MSVSNIPFPLTLTFYYLGKFVKEVNNEFLLCMKKFEMSYFDVIKMPVSKRKYMLQTLLNVQEEAEEAMQEKIEQQQNMKSGKIRHSGNAAKSKATELFNNNQL